MKKMSVHESIPFRRFFIQPPVIEFSKSSELLHNARLGRPLRWYKIELSGDLVRFLVL